MDYLDRLEKALEDYHNRPSTCRHPDEFVSALPSSNGTWTARCMVCGKVETSFTEESATYRVKRRPRHNDPLVLKGAIQ